MTATTPTIASSSSMLSSSSSRRCARKGCYFDIELASLGRLENIVNVVIRKILDERDAFVRQFVSLHLNVVSRATNDGVRGDRETTANVTTNSSHWTSTRSPPLLLSHVRIFERETPVTKWCNDDDDDDDDDDDENCAPKQRYDDDDAKVDAVVERHGGDTMAATTTSNDDGVVDLCVDYDRFVEYMYPVWRVFETNDAFDEEIATMRDNCLPSREVVEALNTLISIARRNTRSDDDSIDNNVVASHATTTNCEGLDDDDELRVAWFVERFDRFVETTKRYETSRQGDRTPDNVATQRLKACQYFSLIPRATYNDDESSSSSSSRNSLSWIATLHLLLFFQWFRLMSILPLEYDSHVANFAWLPLSNVVRVFVCRHAYDAHFLPETLLAAANATATAADRRSSMTESRVIERRYSRGPLTVVPLPAFHEFSEDDEDATIANDEECGDGSTDSGVNDVSVVSARDVTTIHSATTRNTVESMLSREGATDFVVTDGTFVVTPNSRVRNGLVDVIVRGTATDRALNNDDANDILSDGREGGGFVRKRRRGGDRVDCDDSTKRRKIDASNFRNGVRTNDDVAATESTRMTIEQRRVLSLVESVLGVPLLSETSSTRKDDDFANSDNNNAIVSAFLRSREQRRRAGDRLPREVISNAPSKVPCETTKNERCRTTDRRRVIIDGVAGAGKTFMLGALLRKFDRVVYLVKKRSFVDGTKKRFHRHENLFAQTIDAFLMRHLGIRSLPHWLHKRTVELDDLERQLRMNPVSVNDRELIFIDEYSLIERSLARLLNVALVDRLVVLVGDCNQQPAIGDATDQPVRTLLGYENVCFMYDNVRTKDARLLRRLSYFNAKTDDVRFLAVQNLPLRRYIDMSDFFELQRRYRKRSRGEYSTSALVETSRLLPRVIVTSNAKVNYLNWAIGYTMMRHIRPRRDRCLRYKRKIVVTRDALNDLLDADGRANDWSVRLANGCTDEHASFADDAFADEHFVIVGVRYRIVHALESWPAQVGSRVIVTAILSNDRVRVVTDDDRAISFVVRKTRVKPYEYHSRWCALAAATPSNTVAAAQRRDDVSSYRTTEHERCDSGRRSSDRVRIYMFPIVMDVATTVYQVQGLTLETREYERCYVDVQNMDEKALYVTLSRFQNENQIHGVINCHTLH